MSTNFVHLVGLFFGVFCFASLHQVQPMVIFTNTTLNEEPINATKINVVNGDQYLSKRLKSQVALAEPETVRDPRMTVIENQVVRGGSYYRPERELLADGEKTRDRRYTEIRFNEVNGNQYTSKKREIPAALAESETVRDPRMTIINGQLFTKGGRVFPAERELLAEEEKTLDRRATYIRFNEVNGDQHTSKKRESSVAPTEPEPVRNRRYTEIRFNEVNGNQYTSKKREIPAALAESETVRDPRFTIIHENDVHGDQIIRGKRATTESKSEDEKTHDRRYTYIRFNEVNGDQHTSKKRESSVALTEPEPVRHRRSTNIETSNVAVNQIMYKKRESSVPRTEPETVRDRRMTIIESPIYYRYPVSYSQAVRGYPSVYSSRADYGLNQAWERLQNSAYRLIYPSRAISSSLGTQYQYVSVPMASGADSNTQSVQLSATPNFVSQMTVNGNQYLSKK